MRHKEIDLGEIVARQLPRIRSFKVVDCMGGGRSATLWQGLGAVSGEYFAVLDDDDWWFSDHFEQLFQPLPRCRLEGFFAYGGSIAVRPVPESIEGGARERRALHGFGIESWESWSAVTSAFASNCFVASSDLLKSDLLTSPEMETAEDSYLILSLLAQAEPRFSYGATSIFDRSGMCQSRFAEHPKRYEDELTLQLRLFSRQRPWFLSGDAWNGLAEFWSKRPVPANRGTDVVTLLRDWEQVGGGYDPKQSRVSGESRLLNSKAGSALIRPPLQPWAYGAELFLNRPSRASAEYVLIAEVTVSKGVVGVGVLNLAENDFFFRKRVSASTGAQTVQIRILNFSQVGPFVVQNWDMHGESIAELLSIRLFAEPA